MSSPPMYPAYMYVAPISIEERIKRITSILPNVILRPSIKIPYSYPLSVGTVPQNAAATAVERHTYRAQRNK